MVSSEVRCKHRAISAGRDPWLAQAHGQCSSVSRFAGGRGGRHCQATIGAFLVESVSPPPSALPPSCFCLLAWWRGSHSLVRCGCRWALSLGESSLFTSGTTGLPRLRHPVRTAAHPGAHVLPTPLGCTPCDSDRSAAVRSARRRWGSPDGPRITRCGWAHAGVGLRVPCARLPYVCAGAVRY